MGSPNADDTKGERTMTRMKALILGTLTTVMILGSTIVLAGEIPASDSTTIDATNGSVIEMANPGPTAKRGGGGSGRALKK